MRESLPRITAGDTSATIDPVGGRVASFEVGRRAILFAPAEPPPERRDWVDPPGTWIHAGNPVLFPQAGTLAGHRFVETGTTLKPHGIVYQRPWSVELQEPSRLVVAIESDEATRRAYPFSWRILEEVELGPGTLRFTLRITNTDTVELPVAPGYHPYFALPLDEKSRLQIDEVVGFRPPAGPDVEIDDVLVLPRHPLSVHWPSGELRLTTSNHFGCLVVYTAPGQPYICIEPWIAPPNSLNDPAARIAISPGATLALWMEVSVL
ncbi:MAG: Aldose 1-epimerase [Chloroflexi bacterium]|nr:Aldose 1-epimerase [Chloroflexota bacterium]